MAPLDSTVAQRLRQAIESKPVSVRALSRRLAARDDVTASADSLQRSLRKWLAGDTIGSEYQAILEDELGCPPGFLYEADVTALKQRDIERRLRLLEPQVATLQARLEALVAADEVAFVAQEENARRLREHESRLGSLESARASQTSGRDSAGTGSHLD